MHRISEGPWFVSKPKGEHRAFVMSGDGRICTVAYNKGRMHVNSHAYLLAAAPNMLEALEQAVTSMLDSGYSTNSLPVMSCLAAIAKAKGESK